MRYLIMPVLALALAGCNTDSQSQRTVGGAALGAATGAAIGGIAGGWQGAGIGALAGGAAGALIGHASTPNNCIFQNANGQRFIGPCP